MTVAFFGHGDADVSLQKSLSEAIEALIVQQHADMFYVGTHGNFDRMATEALYGLKQKYPKIQAYSVLSRMPAANGNSSYLLETIFPEEVARAHPKNAIIKRNEWMLEKSDVVITYVICSTGGAAIFKSRAIKKGKSVIEISVK